MTQCVVLCTPCIFIKLLFKHCSNSKHCVVISISFGSFLCSDVPWIIIFDVVWLFGSKMYQTAAFVLGSFSLVLLYRVRQKNLKDFKSRYIGNRVVWGNATKVIG